jgi:hypothetical protein
MRPDAEADGYDEDQAIAMCLHIWDGRVQPGREEAEDDFMLRCVEMHEGGNTDEQQAIAICEALWKKGFPEPQFKEFDESQHPRDEHGRWTDSGGGQHAGEEESKDEAKPDYSPEHAAMVKKIATAVAEELAFPTEKIHYSTSEDKFDLNGRKATAAGVTQGEKVTLFPPMINNETDAAGVISHEIEHAKFNRALKRMNEERAKAEGLDVLDSDGNVRPLHKGNFPACEIMKKALIDVDPSRFAKGDGASHYSLEYWQQAAENRVSSNFVTAVRNARGNVARQIHDRKVPATPRQAQGRSGLAQSLSRRRQGLPSVIQNVTIDGRAGQATT